MLKLTAHRLSSNVFAALCILACVMETTAENFIVFHLQDRATMEFALSEDPIISFDNDNIILTGSTTIEFPLNTMVDIEYLEHSSVKDNIDTTTKPFIRKDNTLIFSNFDTNSSFDIFSMDGIRVFSDIIPANSSYQYDLDRLMSGVYIISVNNVSYKIMIR